MDGIELTNDAVTGVLAGIGHSVDSIEATVNNQYMWTIATMLIGIALAFGVVMYFVKGHRKI